MSGTLNFGVTRGSTKADRGRLGRHERNWHMETKLQLSVMIRESDAEAFPAALGLARAAPQFEIKVEDAGRQEGHGPAALGACPTLPFVTRRRRCGQMRGRRPGKTGGVFAGIH
jgi:hypothetical protein